MLPVSSVDIPHEVDPTCWHYLTTYKTEAVVSALPPRRNSFVLLETTVYVYVTVNGHVYKIHTDCFRKTFLKNSLHPMLDSCDVDVITLSLTSSYSLYQFDSLWHLHHMYIVFKGMAGNG